tara:strand:+ start:142 stop:738 length:597 start_codon:yes stop_codon:yes gene_type:complete
MVNLSKIEILKKLDKLKNLKKDDQVLFKKLAIRYPIFIPFKVINLILSKKYNSLDYDENLEICSKQISDRTYLYKIIQNKILSEDEKFELLSDLKEKSFDNKKSFIEWIKSTKSLIENEDLSYSSDLVYSLFKDSKKKKVKKIKKEDYMTETLAELYIEQKKFKDALKAYEILSLKYPEKISLFADQIIFLKKKLKNV